jgi:hypothetical protein
LYVGAAETTAARAATATAETVLIVYGVGKQQTGTLRSGREEERKNGFTRAELKRGAVKCILSDALSLVRLRMKSLGFDQS